MMNNLIFIDSYSHSYKNYCKDINLIKTKAGLRLKDSVVYLNSNKISFGVIAKDITNTSPFKFGITTTRLEVMPPPPL